MTQQQATTPTDADPAAPVAAPFGSVFAPTMAVSWFDGERWSAPDVVAVDTLALHPGTHALHYGSSCFEGLKAHRHPDGRVVPFRAERHVARLRQSAGRLCLPVPPAELVADAHRRARSTPPTPSPRRRRARCTCARPCSAPTSRSAPPRRPALTAVLYVLACPVGDYLPPRPLTIAVETAMPRTTPQFGVVKTGANYAMALSPIMRRPRAATAPTRCCSPRAAGSRRRARRTCCCSTATTCSRRR